MQFDNSYARLDPALYEKTAPTPVRDPQMFLWNGELAESLQIEASIAGDPRRAAQIFGGNSLPPGAEPIATAYAGHQFGMFVPQLGDGRAHLLGEVRDREGRRRDIQLKGSGRTGFSRGGDGRCRLGPAVREYIMSEALYALGVPTTRCLAVVSTGESVFREGRQPGAVVTRVADSHIRVGTFQLFAARGDEAALRTLCNYTIERHYPQIDADPATADRDGPNPERMLALIEQVMARQIRLIVEWMRIGFIHGVMNTDNTALSGETIDYGPCAMMSAYDPRTVFSSIDRQGRYAFGNQPAVAQWNMAQFAQCLLPLVDEEPSAAVEQLQPLINTFPKRYEAAFIEMMAGKIGLREPQADDQALIRELLERLNDKRPDYTQTFDRLTRALSDSAEAEAMGELLGQWYEQWQARLAHQSEDRAAQQQWMRRHNPVVIPRNHHMEAVIEQCEITEKPDAAQTFLRVLRRPYEHIDGTEQFVDPPADNDEYYQTFCGT